MTSPIEGAEASEPVLGLKVQISLAASHGSSAPGFECSRAGVFSAVGAGGTEEAAAIEIEDLTVLGIPIARIRLTPNASEAWSLAIDFANLTPAEEAEGFVHRMLASWSADLAVSQRDPWNGILTVEGRWSTLEFKRRHMPMMTDSLSIDVTQTVPVDKNLFDSMRWSPLVDVFVEGMKASQPKSKFLFWFVILEELEKREELQTSFTPLFSNAEKTDLRAAIAGNAPATQRLDGLLNNSTVTVEGRPEKLCTITKTIGLQRIEGLNGPIQIDRHLCKSLITQRNQVAHKGSRIDEDLLYNVLFPLAQRALTYLLDQEGDAAGMDDAYRSALAFGSAATR